MKQFMKLCGALLMSSISLSVAQFPNNGFPPNAGGFGNLPNNIPVPSGPRNFPSPTFPPNWPSSFPKLTFPTNWPTSIPKLTFPTNWPTNTFKLTFPTNWPTNFPTGSGRDGIKCYVCARCNAPTGLRNCGTGVTQCMTVFRMGRIDRKCGASGQANACTKDNLLGVETNTCYCDTDSCNGDVFATTATPTPTTDGITDATEPTEGSGDAGKNTSVPSSSTTSSLAAVTTTTLSATTKDDRPSSPATTNDDRPSSTLQCYVCSDCAAPKGLTTCPVHATQCLKVVSGGSVKRSCGAGQNTDSCTSLNSLGINIQTCSCNTDSCNGAGSLKGFTVLATLAAVFLAKMLM